MNNEVTRQSLGIVSMSYKDDYSSSTTYNRGNVVVYEGSSYVAKRTTTGNLPTNTTYFQLIAQKPVKGVDYFTQEDIDAIVSEVTEDAESEFNRNVVEKTGEFNQNATNKTNTFNFNAESKTTDFNDNASTKTTNFNTNATNKTTAFNSNATDKTTSFDGNASDKTTAFNNNATSKTGDFDSNASSKTTAYNENHTSKLAEYNQNASDKLTAYNNNHTAKLSAYNENAEEKVEEFDEHVDELEERVEVLETVIDGLPKVEGEGTDIQLKETIESPLKMELSPSELEQVTTTGINLLPNITTQTLNGITITNNGDGSYTLNGTATANTYFDFFVGTFDSSASEGYYLKEYNWDNISSLFGTSTSKPLSYRISSSNRTAVQSMTGNDNGLLQIVDNGTDLYLAVRINSGGVLTNVIIKPMLVATQEDLSKDVEPYTGNAPSPSPDYPQEVKRIWGDNNLIISNNNLLESQTTYSTTGGSSGGVAYTRLDTFTPITSPITLSAAYKGIAFVSKVKKGLTYTFSSDATNMTGSTVSIYEKFEDMTDRTKQLERFIGATFTPNYDGYALLCMYSNSSSSREHSWTYGKLELGTVATDYVLHEGKKYPLNLGVKNLFDKDNANILDNTFIGSSSVANQPRAKCLYIPVLPNTTYTVSKIKSARFAIATTTTQPSLNTSIYDKQQDNDATSLTITTSLDTQYLIMFYYFSDYDTLIEQQILDSIQIEKGSKAHSYSEYGVEPVEYCAIGDYKDEFFYNSSKREDYIDTLENNKWYLKKNVGKVVLNGSENWNVGYNGTNSYTYQNNYIKLSNTQGSPRLIISDAFIGVSYDNRATAGNNIIYSNTERIYSIYIRNTEFTTLESFTTWLSTHNTTVYYVLDTPQYVLLNTTIQKQLNDIAKALSYNEETNISQENEELPFQISASTLRDINSMFESLETRIAELETA